MDTGKLASGDVQTMSKGERWTVAIGLIGLVAMGLQVWLALLHEEEHRAGIMSIVFTVLLAILIVAVNIWAIYRNLRDSGRSKALRAQIITIKDEQKTQLTGRETRYRSEIQELKEQHKKAMDELRSSLIEEIQPKYMTDPITQVGRAYLTYQKAWYAPSKPESTDYYRHKVNFIFTNGPKEIEVWTPLWESAEVACQTPLASALFREGPKGYLANDYENPNEGVGCTKLNPGQSFKGWIGLLPPQGDDLHIRTVKRTTGVVIFPIKIGGKLTYERVQI